MKINLAEVPFSIRGSYMVICDMTESFKDNERKTGLYLRTVHGGTESSFIARIVPIYQNHEVEYRYEAEPCELKIFTDYGKAGIAFVDSGTIMIKGTVCLKFQMELSEITYAQPWRCMDREFHMVNSFGCRSRYLFHAQKGSLLLDQKWCINHSEHCSLFLCGNEKEDYVVTIEEYQNGWYDRRTDFLYEESVTGNRKAFERFCKSMPEIPCEYESAAEIASYVNWSSFVAAAGILTRETMYMSKNWMCNVWSWDHCFNAIALAYHNPREAWDQYMVLFDYQDQSGCLPDCVNDSGIVTNFCKPPIHGWTLKKLRSIMVIDESQMAEAYVKLSKWTDWWLNFRDLNQDGLCEYSHGNDSGWDNSTAFQMLAPVTLPDLAGFLIMQMDELAYLAEKLNYHAESKIWKERSDSMLDKMLHILFKNEEPAAFAGFEMKQVNTESLILYLPIILGERLPEGVRNKMVAKIKGSFFHTPYGLATENPQSPFYEPDGYWRGPIWAPSTMIVLEGMWACGEKSFVRNITRKFCDLVQKSGCAENFDGMSGEGLRDRSYTWTASIMLVMAHEYLYF